MKSLLRTTFFSIIFLCFTASLMAQNEKKIIKEAEKNYEIYENKKEALKLYLEAYALDPENPETNYWVGRLYLETAYRARSLKYLKFAYESESKKVEEDVLYLLAQSYHLNHEFETAIEHYKKYQDEFLKEKDDLYPIVNWKIKQCKTGIELKANPIDVTIENVGPTINSEFPDYAPVINATETEMVFTSRRPGSTGGLLDPNSEYYEDIYITYKSNGRWLPPKSISDQINEEYHDASIGLSADGNELFIYKDDGKRSGDIYVSDVKDDGTWSKPVRLPSQISDKRSYENSVAVSPDKKTLIFASDREGGLGDVYKRQGYGGLDLYMCTKNEKGDWGEPVNLGSKINTRFSEDGPFMDLNGRILYFSSKGHKSMGGFDIFKTVLDPETGEWSEPENMGYPLNTADDDIYFVLSGDGSHGYYASAREDSYGEKDIYLIKMPPREDIEELLTKLSAFKEAVVVDTVKEEITPPALMPVKLVGTITDAATGEPLAAKVELVDFDGNTIAAQKAGEDGKYSFNMTNASPVKYNLEAEMVGYMPRSSSVNIPAPAETEQEIVKDLALSKPEKGGRIILRNIYFDFDKATLKSPSYKQLDKVVTFMKENPTVKIEVGGHTDYIGSNAYNKSLSARRAKAAMKYLISKGIDASRLTSAGYGEEVPLASNDDELDGREINRRTEFKILSK